MKLKCQFGLLLLLVLLPYSTGIARFLGEDADKIETAPRSREYNLDILVYQNPYIWRKPWLTARYGYKISAGSLDINRMYLDEELKFKFNGSDKFRFWVQRNRHDDLPFQREHQELSFWWALTPEYWVSVLGEPLHLKKFSDIGLAFAYESNMLQRLQVKVLGVDYPYNQKEDDRGTDGTSTELLANRLQERPWAMELSALWYWPSGTYLDLEYDHDFPLKWDRYSHNYHYESRSESLRAYADLVLSPDFHLLNQLGLRQYRESKDLYRTEDPPSCMSAESDWQEALVDIGPIYRLTPNSYMHSGARMVDLSLTHRCDTTAATAPKVRNSRREYIPYFFFNLPLGTADESRWQIGPAISSVTFPDDSRPTSTEAKLQVAFDLNFPRFPGKDFRVLLNTSWDLDYIISAYPYNDKPFLPWDGGNVQFMATL